jgi:methylmalonyl-CoA/ethylmalonyl-CoA epimerase
MIKVKRIDHVAIATGDRDHEARKLSALFGLCVGASEHVAGQKTDVTFLIPDTADIAKADPTTPDPSTGRSARLPPCASALEIISPAGPTGNPGLARFLDRRGPGLHHICFEVDDLPGALASLKAAGVRLIDEAPRPGARGHLVAFIHPASTGGVLFELCATPNGAQA